MRCWVKSRNERNPFSVLPALLGGNSQNTACKNRRKVRTTSSHHAPYVLGYTHATMAGTKGREAARWSQSHKTGLSSDCSLQLDYMKSELLVNVDQPCYVEFVPGPCTHRPSHHESRLYPKSLSQPAREASAEGMAGNWDEVVTR